MSEVIVHVDIDYFFAQVEEVRDPSLRSHPMGVQQHMEVAAVNYEARKYGLYNRILVADAKRLCPHLVLVRGDNEVNGMQRYRQASQSVLNVIARHLSGKQTQAIPAVVGRRLENPSFDDFYIVFEADATDARTVHQQAADWAAKVRGDILSSTGLKTSAGIASTKLLAMLATKRGKPNGQHAVLPPEEEAFMLGQKLINLKGAGLIALPPESRTRLVERLGEEATLGKWRQMLREGSSEAAVSGDSAAVLAERLSRGVDGSEVTRFALPKTISVELCVRVNAYDPCTERSRIAEGYIALSNLLLTRALEDQSMFGDRRPVQLVAKWKLFPSARTVKQKQTAWPFPSLRLEDAPRLGEAAANLFNVAQTEPFKVSRLVLGLSYGESAPPSCKPTGLTEAGGKRKQISLLDAFKQPKRLSSVASVVSCAAEVPPPAIAATTDVRAFVNVEHVAHVPEVLIVLDD
eukprot:TRINITY_DN37729_c0_g1_i1.p1 TRINITY_DN37729_c0_g1~~TRINITY_DN37729_c0_g1_i1.p1  ORF type:complete len:463 (-),score=71.79 TRINITY_DN37729_c0_g1_i1:75-1463(-)